MADQRSWVSPYNYVQNNPLSRIDPTGALDNPIYDEDGNFLGADDKGLRGEAIVMNKNDFTEGMSHETALEKGTALSSACGLDCIGTETFDKITEAQSFLNSNLDMLDRAVGIISDGITNADASATSFGGIGLNFKEINRYGNSGDRFRASVLGSGLKLKGAMGSKFVAGLKVGGPMLSVASIGLSLTSNQSNGYKITDTATSLYGIFGGLPGAAVSVGWGFGVKPLHRMVHYPTHAEELQRWQMQVKYCNSPNCK